MRDAVREGEFDRLFNDHLVVDAGLVLDIPDRHPGKEEIIAEHSIRSESSHPVFTNWLGYNTRLRETRLDDFNEFHEAVTV